MKRSSPLRERTKMKQEVHFVYCPRSGDRWINDPATATLPVVVWNNGSVHVVGHRITIEAAARGHWWRTAARQAAGLLADHFGGLAWDECGTVSLVLPPSTDAARTALRILWAVRQAETGERTDWECGRMVRPLGDDAIEAVRAVGVEHAIAALLSDVQAPAESWVHRESITLRPCEHAPHRYYSDEWNGCECAHSTTVHLTCTSSPEAEPIKVQAPWGLREVHGAAAPSDEAGVVEAFGRVMAAANGYGVLLDYETCRVLRWATEKELVASRAALPTTPPWGLFVTGGRVCYVCGAGDVGI